METRNVFIQVIKKPARKHGFTLLRAKASPQNKRRLLFSFGFLVSCDSVSCDSVSWAEENSEYINSITSEESQSEKEQKLADEACAPTNGFYKCAFYDKRILDAINKYIKQRRPDSIMYYDPGLHEICITHSKKMANKKQIFNINVKKISAGYKFVAQKCCF